MSSYPHQIDMEIMGCTLRICCRHEPCANGIREYFEAVIKDAIDTSPDVVIRCNWRHVSRYLFRSRPLDEEKLLKGVSYLNPNTHKFLRWNFHHPPIPPFPIYPFKDRFVGLHAAAVECNNYATIFVGEKGSGKSTITSLILKKDKRFSFITDETVLVHRRTIMIDPFPRAIHAWRNENDVLQKYIASPFSFTDNIRNEPAYIGKIIFLEPFNDDSNEYECKFHKISKIDASQRLMYHNVDLGTDYHESLTTVINVAQQIQCEVFCYKEFGELSILADSVIDKMLTGR